MRLITLLFLVISTLSLGACNGTVLSADECSTFRDIRFSEETKTWLAEIEWPESAFADFDKVGKHNEKYEERCERGRVE